MALSGLDSVIGQSLSGLNTSLGGNAASGVAGMSMQMPPKAASATNRTDVVTLSQNVPEPIEASTLELSEKISQKVKEHYTLNRKETGALKESRILAILTGMQLMQPGTDNNLPLKLWSGGLPSPTAQELDEAYRRLTQKLSNPTQSKDFESINKIRMEMLDEFREADFTQLAQKTPEELYAEAALTEESPEPAEASAGKTAFSNEPSPAVPQPPASPIRLVA